MVTPAAIERGVEQARLPRLPEGIDREAAVVFDTTAPLDAYIPKMSVVNVREFAGYVVVGRFLSSLNKEELLVAQREPEGSVVVDHHVNLGNMDTAAQVDPEYCRLQCATTRIGLLGSEIRHQGSKDFRSFDASDSWYRSCIDSAQDDLRSLHERPSCEDDAFSSFGFCFDHWLTSFRNHRFDPPVRAAIRQVLAERWKNGLSEDIKLRVSASKT